MKCLMFTTDVRRGSGPQVCQTFNFLKEGNLGLKFTLLNIFMQDYLTMFDVLDTTNPIWNSPNELTWNLKVTIKFKSFKLNFFAHFVLNTYFLL